MGLDSRSLTQAIVLAQLSLFLVALVANEVAVVCLFLIALLFPLIAEDLRDDRPSLIALYIVISVHFVVTLINATVGPVIGADLDAETFHIGAENIVQEYKLSLGFDYIFYENLLAVFYYGLGSTRAVGGSISLIAFTLAAMVYSGVLKQLQLGPYRVPLFLAFGLVPSTVFLTSVTLRESWELLFLLSCIYCIFRYFEDASSKARWLLLAFACSAVLGMLHKALLFYGPSMIFMALFISFVTERESKNKRVTATYMAVLCLAALALIMLIYQNPVGRIMIFGLINEDPLSVIDRYRLGIDLHGAARSAFHIPFETGSVMQTLGTLSQIYLHYMFAPIGSTPDGLRDWYANTEALIRLSALVLCLYGFARISTFRARPYVFLGVFYMSATLLWALGTTNYGQAIRHHILTNWTLFTLAAPIVGLFVNTLTRHWSNRHMLPRCEDNLH